MNHQRYYKAGFKKSVSDTHNWRKVKNSVDFIEPYLKPEHTVLDVGCGPGSITIDLANYVKGKIVGVEPTEELLDVARENLSKLDDRLSEQVTFQLGSIYELPFPDKSFDVVFAHQVIIHLEFPEKGLKEMARVAKKLVLVKDSDTASVVTYPDVYQDIFTRYFNRSKSGFTKLTAGRSLKETAIKAGYDPKRIVSSASVWNISNYDDRERWADMILARIESSGELDSSSSEEVDGFKQAWRNWKTDEAGWLSILHGEIAYSV